jgi:hypothetical protein
MEQTQYKQAICFVEMASSTPCWAHARTASDTKYQQSWTFVILDIHAQPPLLSITSIQFNQQANTF